MVKRGPVLHESIDLRLGSRILTLREVLTKRHNVLKARHRLEQDTRGQGHNQMSCGFTRLTL